MTNNARIAIFDAEPARHARARSWLETDNTVFEGSDPNELADGHDLALAEVSRVPALVAAFRARAVDIPVIALVPNVEAGVQAIRAGAYDAVCDPLDRERLEGAVRRARERQELAQKCRMLQRQLEGDEIVPLRELERRAIEKALAATRGSVEKAARMLGMGRATLYRRLATMGGSARQSP